MWPLISALDRIGIDGEAEYRKQIQQITQQQKTLNSEMKKTAEVFKSDADSKKKNAEQTKILTQQIENQKAKVAQINEMYQKSVQQTGENSTATLKWKQALNNAETELAKMENQLKSMQPAAKSFAESLEASGQKLTQIGGTVTKVGTGLTKGLTAPLAAVGAASIKAFNDVDAGLDTIIKKTGVTGDQLTEFQGIMNNLATTIPTTFENAGSAIGEVNTRFGVTGQQLEDLSGQFIKFAELNNTDVSTSIDNVQKVTDAFGLTVQDTGPLLDTLNKVGQDTGISVDKLAQSMVTNGSALREMNMNAADAARLIGQLEKSGIDTSVAMTGLAKVQQAAYKDGIPMQEAFAQALSSSGDAIEIFGAKAGPKLYEAFSSGILGIDMFSGGMSTLNDNLGSVSETFTATLDPIDQWQLTLNQLKITGAEIGNNLMTVLQPVLIQIGEVVKQLGTWFSGLTEQQQQNIVKMGLFVAAAGPLVTAIGGVITTVGNVLTIGSKLIKTFNTISSAVSSAGGIMAALSSPVGIAVAAIGAAIAIGVVLYKNWDTIKATAQALGEKIRSIFNSIKETVSNVINTVKTTISNGFHAALNTVSNIFNSIKNTISNVMNGAKNIVSGAINFIKGLFNFSWSLPPLKLPHFSISGGFNIWPPSVPHISVDWYKKAYTNAVMFNSPTVIPTASGLKGFGDGAGGEIVIGQNMLMNMISGAMNRGGASGATINIVVNPAPGMDEEQLAELVAERINEQIQIGQEVYA